MKVTNPFPYIEVSEFIPSWVMRTAGDKSEQEDPEVLKLAMALGSGSFKKAPKRPDTVTFLAAVDAMCLAYHACGVGSQRELLLFVSPIQNVIQYVLQVMTYTAARGYTRCLWEIGANAAHKKRKYNVSSVSCHWQLP